MSQNQHVKTQIIQLESKLLKAFADKDLEVIAELLHDDALFIYPNGMTVTKAMVLENYRTGNSAFSTIEACDQLIQLYDDSAVVAVTLNLKGNYKEQQISALFRYIRVWKCFEGKWKAIAVSGVPLPKE